MWCLLNQVTLLSDNFDDDDVPPPRRSPRKQTARRGLPFGHSRPVGRQSVGEQAGTSGTSETFGECLNFKPGNNRTIEQIFNRVTD